MNFSRRRNTTTTATREINAQMCINLTGYLLVYLSTYIYRLPELGNRVMELSYTLLIEIPRSSCFSLGARPCNDDIFRYVEKYFEESIRPLNMQLKTQIQKAGWDRIFIPTGLRIATVLIVRRIEYTAYKSVCFFL